MNEQLQKILTRVQKPGRYTGGEPGILRKNPDEVSVRFAFCFPDTYEIGMSFLGMKVLYDELNRLPDIACERAFMPWVDMADELKREGYPLYALESKDPLTAFDIVGFTLQYELTFTNILAMLDLAGIPLRAADRDESYPLVLGGGPCSCNPEPIAPFFDAFLLGEGEGVTVEICRAVAQAKAQGLSKDALLHNLSQIEGVYVPSLYHVEYAEDGVVAVVTADEGAPLPVKKALLTDFSSWQPTRKFVVPLVGTVHDRAQVEVLRGCIRGCRFCQAGFIYRPMRERPAEMLDQSIRDLCAQTGYEEVSLTSLSTSDHSELEPLMDGLLDWTSKTKINLSLPSLRVDNFTKGMVDKISKVRKSGLTFAPEAGTQRLRDVINKNVTDEEIDRTCTLAFEAGYTAVKLYFMMGLPTETMEDIEGIAETARRVVALFDAGPNRPKGKGVKVSISVACFVPKPFTPFQYCGQDSMELLKEKQQHLLHSLHSKKISVSYHDNRISFLEAVFARGDRRLADVIEAAYKAGCRFDGWDDQFRYDTWMETFEALNLDPRRYAERALTPGAPTPWSHLDYGVEESFLAGEYAKALEGDTTQNCRESCAGCGITRRMGGPCFA